MAIELGALALAIRDQGGDAVLAKLRKIDGEARKAGGKPVRVPVSAPGADQAATKLRLVGTSAASATKSVASLGATLKTFAVGAGIGAGLTALAGLGSLLGDSARAFDDAEAAARKLNASAKLTGASLDDVQRIAKEGQTAFLLSAAASADLTANVVKLTSRAGELNKSGEFMARWLDLAAANGLSAAEAMQALQTTIIGQDEGLNRLGLANPQQIYEGWARAAGMSAAKMTEAQKAQAIINEIVTKGGLVQGEYSKSLDTAAGKTALLAQRTEQLKVALGNATLPTRLFVVEFLTQWAEKGARVVDIMGRLSDRVGGFGNALRTALRVMPIPGMNAALDLMAEMGKGKPKAPAVTWQTLGGDRPTPPAAKSAVDAKEAAKAESDRQAQIARQVGAVETMVRLRATDIGTLQAAVRLEGLLTTELAKGTASLERRAEIQQQLATLRQSGALIKPLEVRDLPRSIDMQAATKLEVPVELKPKMAPEAGTETEGWGLDLGVTFGTALAAGIQQAFASGSATDGLKAIGATILSAFGDMFVQIGVTALAGSKMLAGILAGLQTLNPFAMAAAAVGLIAIGAALKGAASAAVGRNSAMRGGGGFSSGAPSSSLSGRQTIADANIRRATLPANARGVAGARAATMPAGPTLHVLGVNTPQGQRLIGESSANFRRRGG